MALDNRGALVSLAETSGISLGTAPTKPMGEPSFILTRVGRPDFRSQVHLGTTTRTMIGTILPSRGIGRMVEIIVVMIRISPRAQEGQVIREDQQVMKPIQNLTSRGGTPEDSNLTAGKRHPRRPILKVHQGIRARQITQVVRPPSKTPLQGQVDQVLQWDACRK